MLAFALIVPLLVASADECCLVTSDGIQEIPREFSASAIDALRYAAEETPEAKARRARQPQRDAAAARAPQHRTFGRGSTRNQFRR